jgi:hypothetical protein
MGLATVVDVSFLAGEGEPGVSPFIEPDHVEAWEREHSELRAGEVVLFRTAGTASTWRARKVRGS